MITNPQYPHHLGTAQLIYNEIIRDDCYRVRALPTAPAVVFDIGGNVGFFSVMARMLWPRARITAFEPCPETRDILRQNTAHLDIHISPFALGTGQPVRLERNPHSDGGNRCVAGAGIETLTLASIVNGCDQPYLLKLDCEAGEASILNEPFSEHALRSALHWGMEYHQNWVGIPGATFLQELQRIDPRATGEHYRGNDWLMWSAATVGTAGPAVRAAGHGGLSQPALPKGIHQ